MNFLSFLVPLSVLLTVGLVSTSETTRDYCIIGAGPSGLQMGHLLKKAGRDYIIYERNDVSGSFFKKFPIHRKLISINKVFTGWKNEEFNLRHDWNSLLSDDPSLQLRHYTEDFFPNADVFVEYLKDYTEKHGLSVQYNTNVRNVRKDFSTNFVTFEDQHDHKYNCKYVIMATGLSKANSLHFNGADLVEKYEDLTLDKKKYRGTDVLILGRGNSAFETADYLMGVTNHVHMVARSRVKLSWNTHYVGDLRAINNGLLDTYQLKSLDGLLEFDANEMAIVRTPEGRLRFLPGDAVEDPGIKSPNGTQLAVSDRTRYITKYVLKDYDHVIGCVGFKFDQSPLHPDFQQETNTNGKYPSIKWTYESRNIPDLYFTGTVTHSLDFRKSSGGFIHGFRYTTRTLHRLLEWKNHAMKWPSTTHLLKDLVNVVIRRINQASGNYQMFSVLADVYILRDNDFDLLQEFPVALLPRLEALTGHKADKVVVFLLEYGPDYSGADKDTLRDDRAVGIDPEHAADANFLHPHFYYYDGLPSEVDMVTKWGKFIVPKPTEYFILVEEFNTDWRHPINHILPLRRFFENITGKDLRHRDPQTCLELSLTYRDLPLQCEQMRPSSALPKALNLDILSSFA